MTERTAARDPEDFSLVLGGPLYQLLLRAGLTRSSLDLLSRRIAASLLLAWLPLLVISLLEGRAFGGVRIPFLMDLEVQVRFLVALPRPGRVQSAVGDLVDDAKTRTGPGCSKPRRQAANR